jgi:predicted transcriptional regulator
MYYDQIPINHYDLSSGTFLNRYWINSEFYQPGGPVFVYDSGESNALDSVERMLERSSSFMGQLLEEFHGIGILWEHR